MVSIIQIDTREKPKAIANILSQFEDAGIKTIRSKMFVGDYMSLDNPRLVVDRKQDLSELCQNVCQDHKRFVRELDRAKESGIKVVILVEHNASIKTLEDVKRWQNPRLKFSPGAITGEKLFKILSTMEDRHKTKFLFCPKSKTGERIIELLEAGENDRE